jgi:putative Mg2+ transporter-C (MgtC) family protein
METLRHFLHSTGGQSETLVWQVLGRLVLAAILGGVIGLEREFKHRPAGLRTNMFICFGSAMFTVLSDGFAAHYGGDHARIAAQIIPGIGFIGAGSILHERGSVTGLTTAATIFVVAAVGMAAGAGFYLFAIFASVVILLSLYVLGLMEKRFGLKAQLLTYEVVGENTTLLLEGINQAVEREHLGVHDLQMSDTGGQQRVQFTVDATQRDHNLVYEQLRRNANVRAVHCFGAQERE